MNRQSDLTIKVTSTIGLRPVNAADETFLLEVYASTRADEMSLLPWSDEQKQAFVRAQFNAQQQHYQKTYPYASHDIVLSGDRMVGRLYVARIETETRIVDITLLPRERNSGIGSHLLKMLLDEAAGSMKPLRIYVENFNPSLRLFERLGFSQSEQHGIHILMERAYVPRRESDEAR